MLINRAQGAYVVDLKSTNGTLVNGKPISQFVLQSGDVIAIGDFRLKYVNLQQTGRPPAETFDADAGGDTQILKAALERDSGTGEPTIVIPVREQQS